MEAWIHPKVAQKHIDKNEWPILVRDKSGKRWIEFTSKEKLLEFTLPTQDDFQSYSVPKAIEVISQPTLLNISTKDESTDIIFEDAALWQNCCQSTYPVTFDYPDGRVTYNSPTEAYDNLYARKLIQTCQELGGKAFVGL